MAKIDPEQWVPLSFSIFWGFQWNSQKSVKIQDEKIVLLFDQRNQQFSTQNSLSSLLLWCSTKEKRNMSPI